MKIKIPFTQTEAKMLGFYLKRMGLMKGSEKDSVIRMMEFSEFRNYHLGGFAKDFDQTLLSVTEDAIKNRDWKFFVRLGRALDKPKVSFFDNWRSVPFLITVGWNYFSQCSDKVITDVLSHILKNDDLTEAAVRKIRQNLGLQKNGSPKFRHFKKFKNGKWLLS